MTNILKFFFCGIITSFLFPPFFILPVGFISFPYLFFLLNSKIIKTKSILGHFFYGSIFGLGLNLIFLYWIKEPFLIYPSTESSYLYSYLLIIYVSIYFGLAFIIINFFRNKFSKLIMIPVIFVVTEIIRENFAYGFPWLTFALLGSANYFFLQISYFIGTYGLSYLIISFFLIPSLIILLIENKFWFYFKIYITFFIIILLVLFLLILQRLNFQENLSHKNEIKISINQLNIDQRDRFKEITKKETFDNIVEIIQNGENYFFIFSETDYPYLIEDNNIVNIFQNILRDNQYLIIGGIRKEAEEYFNSMYFIKKNNFEVFDKKILVPFGEFLPFRDFISFLDIIVGDIDFKVGEKNRFITTGNNINFIPVICYEIIFFNDLLEKNNNFSPIIINITNDAWFGKSSGPYQHFYLSRIRSVEFNKFLIRVSNNGVSAVINNYGKIVKYLPLNHEGQNNSKLTIPSKLSNLTNYHRIIYFFFILVLVSSLLVERKIGKSNSEI